MLKAMRTAIVEIFETDEYTEETYSGIHFAKDVSWPSGENGGTFLWTDVDGDEDTSTKGYVYSSATDKGDHIEVITEWGPIHVRALDPYDGVYRSRARVAQPIEVLEADVLRGGGIVAQELAAVVAADNTVVTLVLETGLGTYVRFSGDWHLLSATSTSLDDLQILPVEPEAVAVFDASDMARVTLSAFDLPRMQTFPNGASYKIMPEPVGFQTR